MARLQDITDQMLSHNPTVDVEKVKQAYVYSAKVHQNQPRRSNEPYLSHPMGVAHILARLDLDENCVVAGLLHDVLEDELASLDEIQELFGSTVKSLVEGVSKLSKLTFSTGRQKQAENVRRMLVAMSEDIRVILIKLADRLHEMQNLARLNLEEKESFCQEALDIYAPLANRLGIHWMRVELEDLAFQNINPEKFQEISEQLERFKQERGEYIHDVVEVLRRTLKENEINAEVVGRLKHLYSIHRKIVDKMMDFDQVYDLVAFRIITENLGDCYRVLGLIHAMWKPVSGRFKDYIAMPKINNYQSLHTTVLGLHGERVEVQIRTRQMHNVAEQGVAAHWVYKEGERNWRLKEKNLQQFGWLRDLLEHQSETKDSGELLESIKIDLFSDEVFAFTPQGDVKALPRGSTVLDFAYSVHTEVGHHCAGARVNGKIAPLRQVLKNGDTVEILTNAHQKPSKDWFSLVRTSRAKSKIRSLIRTEQRRRSQEIGREILERECKRVRVNLNRKWKAGEVGKAAETLEYKNSEEMLVAIGYGKLSAGRVVALLQATEPKKTSLDTLDEAARSATVEDAKVIQPIRKTGILVQGMDDILVRFARCCNPIPGDSLLGVITRGRGVTVHTESCKRLLDSDPERRIEINWNIQNQEKHTVHVRIRCEDRPGLLANITTILSESGINISQINAKSESGDAAVCNLKLGVVDLGQLQDVLRKIKKIKGVASADRVQL